MVYDEPRDARVGEDSLFVREHVLSEPYEDPATGRARDHEDAQTEAAWRVNVDTPREPGGLLGKPPTHPPDRTCPCETVRKRLAPFPDATKDAAYHQPHEHQNEQREADLARVSGHSVPRGSCEITEEHEPGPPEQTTSRVVEREPTVGDLGHTREARDHHPECGSEPPKEHGGTSATTEICLCALEMLVDPASQERHATSDTSEDAAAPSPAHEVTQGVSYDRTGDGRDDHRRERYSGRCRRARLRVITAISAREHEAEERGSLERRGEEDDRQGEPAIERQDPVRDRRQQPIPLPPGLVARPRARPRWRGDVARLPADERMELPPVVEPVVAITPQAVMC